MQTPRPKYILPVIIFSQFAGTSLWFAGNVVLPELVVARQLPADALADITMSVQAGFILGTLVFAFTSLADRVSPSKIFMISAVLGASFNIMLYHWESGLNGVLLLRFLTGFALAGIYPVGMKIAADWYAQGLGKALGYLVGALVLGTAFPHFLKSLGTNLEWGVTLYIISVLSSFGGILVYLSIKDGPYQRKLQKFDVTAIFTLFKHREFRASSLGYFGHMWELYTYWAFLPLLLLKYSEHHSWPLDISFWSFIIIAAGALGCAVGGHVSKKIGNARVALANLGGSGICIALFPMMIHAHVVLFLVYMILWGWTVVGDSPQFSALSARTAPTNLIGSGLTIMNCIGFALTIVSIFSFKWMSEYINLEWVVLFLLPGPILGLLSTRILANSGYGKDTTPT